MEHCKLSNSKHQVSGFQVSGVRCQEQKTKKLKSETSTRARHLYRQSRLTLICPVDQAAETVMEF